MKKVAIVTGATAGIGKAAAALFAEKGWTVYCLARRAEDADGIFGIKTDVSDKTAVEAAVKSIADKEGRIDVLVNNAGMGISGAVEDTPPEAVHKIFEVNFFGTLYATQAVLPVMRAQRCGTIINVSSAAAPLSIPFQAFYSATKSAVSSLTEALRIEAAPFGVKVTSVLPGDVKTDFTSKREKNAFDNPFYGDRIRRSVARMEHDEQNGMPPETIAKTIYKLAVSKNPPVYKVGGASYALLVGLSRFLPKRLVSFAISKLYG